MGVVKLEKGLRRKEAVDVAEGLKEGLELADDVRDVGVPFEVFLDVEAEELGCGVVTKGLVVDGEVEVGERERVEDRVGGFFGVGDEVVGMEVVDEVVEVGLREELERGEVVGGDEKGGVVSVAESDAVGDGGGDVVDVKEEKRGREG
jgi:hypothetical protein